MNKKTITPNPQQPVDRTPTGKLPSILSELSEDTLSDPVLPAAYRCFGGGCGCSCSFDDEDE